MTVWPRRSYLLRTSCLAFGALMLATGAVHAQSNETQSPANAAASQPAVDNAAAANAASTTPQVPSRSQRSRAGNGIEEVVVTAQFHRQRLQDTPIAITAVSGATLEARGQTSVADIGKFSPDVNLSPAGSAEGNGVSAFIRGVGQFSSNFAFEPGVGIYIDDIYYGTTFGANLDLTDLDRVEVLRGPQGTLSGKNSVGGAIKLYSKVPDAKEGGFVDVTYGSYNRVDVRASADLKLTNDLFLRVSGVSKQTDGYFKDLDFGCANPGQGIAASPGTKASCVIGHEGGINTRALRAAMRYVPEGTGLEINLIGDFNDDQSQPVATKLIVANAPFIRSYVPGDPNAGVPFDSRFITGKHSYTSYATFNNGGNYTALGFLPTQVIPGTFDPGRQNSAKNYGGSGSVNYKVNDTLNLTSITAYREARGTTVFDPDGSPLTVLLNQNGSVHKQFTEELRATDKIGTWLGYAFGGFFYDANDRLIQRIQIPNALLDFLTDDPIDNKSESAFGHAELHLIPGLTIVGGVRYTHDSKTYTFHRLDTDGSVPSGVPLTTNFLVAALNGVSGAYNGNHVDWRVAADYRFNPNVMAYGQISTGFKGGGVNPLPYVPDQVRPFGPETLTTFETGVKTDLFNSMLRLDADFFFNRYDGLQENINYCAFSSSPNPCALTTNAGNAHSRGVEVEATLRPVEGLTINGALGYLNFNYLNVNPLTGISPSAVAPFNNTWQAAGSVEYLAYLGRHGTLTPRLDVTYESSYFTDPSNNPYSKVPGHAVVDARLTYETPNRLWTASLQISNLFNKFYANFANENITGYGLSTYSLAPPREVAFQLRRRF